MELRQLEYFSKVGKLKSFTHAAEELHVSQPSITTAINKLEEELGVQLLERTTKNVRLTSKGDLFLKRIDAILSSIQEAVSEVKHSERGTIKFGLPPMIGAYLFPDIFCEINKAYPELEFQVMEKGSLIIRSTLEQGLLEMGILILPEHSELLATLPLVKQQAYICLSAEHPLATQSKIKFEQLANEKFVLLSDEFVHRKVFIRECEKYGITPEIVFSSDKIDTVKALVAKGVGITLLMDMIVKDDKRIIKIPLEDPITFDIGLAWKKSKTLTDDCKKILDFINEYFNENRPKPLTLCK